MPRAGKKKDGAPPKNPRRRGMPDPENVVKKIPFTSPSGETFVILRTNEVDAYEEPAAKEEKKKEKTRRVRKRG
jgi:hypothetical protein